MAKKNIGSFGIFFKAARKNKGYSIKSLAQELNVNYTYLSKIENEHTVPSEEFIRNIARLFGYDEEELLVRAGRIPPDVIRIIRDNPKEAIEFLRRRFSA